MSRNYDTRRQIKPWAALNVVTLGAAVGTFWGVEKLGGKEMLAESLAFIPVFIVSIIDMAELTSGRRIVANFVISVADWIVNLTSRFANWLKGLFT